MKPIRIAALLILVLGLSACSSAGTSAKAPWQPFAPEPEVARLDTGPALGGGPALPATPAAAGYAITALQIEVPRSLTVSEANTYLPRADIVWRGDLPGDRHAQIEALFRDGMIDGIAQLGDAGTRPVTLMIRVHRFHGVTEKARYNMGGVHNILFDMAFVDAETGALLAPVRQIAADLAEPGGQAALALDAAGQTQRVRLRAHLSRVLVDEMTRPGGYANAKLGIVQRINRI